MLAIPSATAASAILDVDDRVSELDQSRGRFAPVGLVSGSSEAAYATGFLISSCHVLTVQHAASQVRSVIGDKMWFQAGPATAGARWRTSPGRVVASGSFERARDSSWGGRREQDWMVIRLKRCLGKQLGHVDLDPAAPAELAKSGAGIAGAGYPLDRPFPANGLSVDRHCRVRGMAGGTLLHDCATSPGNSGGPLFRASAASPGEKLQVVAIHVAAPPGKGVERYDYRRLGLAAPVSAILPFIAQYR